MSDASIVRSIFSRSGGAKAPFARTAIVAAAGATHFRTAACTLGHSDQSKNAVI